MDSLPVELHSQIFELACTDDGTTARSLSRVSRYVREVSQPFLLQSVAVSGLGSLNELIKVLESLPARRRRVRHLFLSDWTPKQAEEMAVSADEASMERYEVERTAIMRVLDLVAPSVESLCLVASCPFNSTPVIAHLFSLQLPLLESLSVSGFYPFLHQANMPKLERLHLTGNRNPHGMLGTGVFASGCPQLTHLKISGLVSAASFAQELEHALLPSKSNSEKGVAGVLFPTSLPPSLTDLSVRARLPLTGRRVSSSARAQHQKMTECLAGLELCADDFSGLRYNYAEHTDDDVPCYQNLRHEWASSFIAGQSHS